MNLQEQAMEHNQIPKETLDALRTRAILEMGEKISKLEEEVRLLTQIIRDYESNKVS